MEHIVGENNRSFCVGFAFCVGLFICVCTCTRQQQNIHDNYTVQNMHDNYTVSQKTLKLETVSIAEPLQNRQHAQNP